MKAASFDYVRPRTLQEALSCLAQTDADCMPIAGGQSLVPMMNFRLAAPERLVDLNGIDELRGIDVTETGLRIGAMTRYSELAASAAIAEKAPLIARALPHIAHAAIRNRGTIGGSAALNDPAAEMPALLLTLDAKIRMTGPDGTRALPASEFFRGTYETALEPGELISAIDVPVRGADQRFGFHELARRHGDYAMAGVALALTGSDPVGQARVAFFSIGDCVFRAGTLEEALIRDGVDAACRDVSAHLAGLRPNGDLNAGEATKRHLAGVVFRRAMAELF